MSVLKNDHQKQRKAVETVRNEESSKMTQVSSNIADSAIIEEFNIADLEQIDVRHKNMSSVVKGSGCLSIINHDRCGKRIHIANCVWRELGCPQFVKVFLKSKQMLVMPTTNNGIAVKFDRTISFKDAVEKYYGKIVLYATETVKRLTAEWDIDFASNCCFTGGIYKKCTINGELAVVITMDEFLTELAAEPKETTETEEVE